MKLTAWGYLYIFAACFLIGFIATAVYELVGRMFK